jgi:hypothetical protein
MSDVRICSVDDVKAGTAARFDVDGHRLCVVGRAGRPGGGAGAPPPATAGPTTGT